MFKKLFSMVSLFLLASVFMLSPSMAQEGKQDQSISFTDLQKEEVTPKYKEARHNKNLELISMYEQHLNDSKFTGEQIAMLQFRLAEKYIEEAHYYSNQSDSTKRNTYKTKGVELYQKILTIQPSYKPYR